MGAAQVGKNNTAITNANVTRLPTTMGCGRIHQAILSAHRTGMRRGDDNGSTQANATDLGRHIAVLLADLDNARCLGQCGQGGHHVVNRTVDIDVPVPTRVFKDLHRVTGCAVGETDQEHV